MEMLGFQSCLREKKNKKKKKIVEGYTTDLLRRIRQVLKVAIGSEIDFSRAYWELTMSWKSGKFWSPACSTFPSTLKHFVIDLFREEK